MSTLCQQVKFEYDHLQALKGNFLLEYEKVAKGGDRIALKRLKRELETAYQELESKLAVSVEQARELLGKENVLGPEEVEKTWGVVLEEIPEIPFSAETLERAKEFGQMLVFRIDKTADAKPLSLEAMDKMLSDRWLKEGEDILLDSLFSNWSFENRNDGFRDTAPRYGWALVSRELLPGSTHKNYVKQTKLIVETLKNQIFKDGDMLPEFVEAIAEWEDYYDRNFGNETEDGIKKLLRVASLKYARELSQLRINQLTRQTAEEIVYDLAFYYDVNRRRLMQEQFIWSNSLSNGGQNFIAGYGDSYAIMGGGSGMMSDHRIGVCLSRRG